MLELLNQTTCHRGLGDLAGIKKLQFQTYRVDGHFTLISRTPCLKNTLDRMCRGQKSMLCVSFSYSSLLLIITSINGQGLFVTLDVLEHYVDQAVLELLVILLPQPPSSWEE